MEWIVLSIKDVIIQDLKDSGYRGEALERKYNEVKMYLPKVYERLSGQYKQEKVS